MVRKSSGKQEPKKRIFPALKIPKDQEPPISQEARTFINLIQELSYKTGPNQASKELTNFTFFAGAGFSKSWDPSSPVGSQLFTLDPKVISQVASPAALYRMFGLDPLFESISPDQLRSINYQIDMYERYPDVRSRYIDEQNLHIFRGALRAAIINRYEKLARLNYFDSKSGKFPVEGLTLQQRNILRFFRYLFNHQDGSQSLVEGIRTQFITTNYDYVVETILDNIIGPDDSLFIYTYRGFTPKKIADQPNISPIHEHLLVQHLLKINGGFEILRQGDGYVLDYSKRKPTEIMQDPPVLMLASREQDYTDPYFRTIFPKAVRLLRDTTILVLVGYSLPEDDALIRFLVRQFAEEAEDGRRKAVFYIGPGTDQQKKDILYKVFPSMKSNKVPRLFTYNGGFDVFADECVRTIRISDDSLFLGGNVEARA